MQLFVKYALLLYYASFFLFAMFLPTYRVWKTTGINPYKLGKSDSAHDYIGRLFRLTLLACALVVLSFAFFPLVYEQLVVIAYLEHGLFVWIGMALLVFSLGWVLLAQSDMQES